MLKPKSCTHINEAKDNPKSGNYECAECIKTGDSWVHLRTCQICGATHCCDSSPNQHATKHFKNSGHQVVQSAEPGEDWFWCYTDKLFVKQS